ncbi:inner-membrane translocator [Caballeronia cordobensis]|uniref:Inner-membrane translocator n=1 Tax=Caballeronia cordobensis TaxID=1353886 RepID=A0A158G7I8_CABCO|nr:ABC transporter permease [Caballeronia cordobensis]SAL28075.1 inner-membrane translocator [Caballeronia cordobensis]
MFELLGIPVHALSGQLLLGLINGSFYALLSLGLAVIFGMLNIVNFAHGAQYMMGAFVSWLLLTYMGIGYWWSLLLAPLLVGVFSVIIERTLLRRIYHLDHFYGLLLTFGLAVIIQSLFRVEYGTTGQGYEMPALLSGGLRLPFMYLPYYRAWVIAFSLAACLATWYVIERTKLGSYLRAATENAALVRAFGINVPRMITFTYASGAALAALAGVLAAPLYQPAPMMGDEILIVVFAVVVIGGMGSIMGSVVTGFGLGVVEGLTKFFYPQASTTVVFVVMILVLLVRPQGLFGKPAAPGSAMEASSGGPVIAGGFALRLATLGLAVLLVLAPLLLYPQFLMKGLCLALYAIALNLLVGYTGLLSFGHAMFLGGSGYIAAHAAKVWGFPPEAAIVAGVAASALLGLAAGLIAIRRKGIYFAMTTLALSQLVYFVCVQFPAFTGGDDGIQAVPRGKLFGLIDLNDQMTMYYVVLVIFMATLLFVQRVIHSPFGDMLKAIRENELRAISLGYKTDRYKLLAFILSAAVAGLGGATKAIAFQFATLTDVHWSMSGEVVLMVLVGGLGTVLGPVVGAFALVAMQYFFAPLGQWVSVAQGLVLIVCVLTFRRGMVGEIAARTGKPL